MWETLESRRTMSVTLGSSSILPYIESQTTSIEDRDKIISNEIQKPISSSYQQQTLASSVQKKLSDTNAQVIDKI